MKTEIDFYASIRRALADMDAASEARNALAWRDAHDRFVVHVAPDTIRALIAERDRLEAEVEALRAEVSHERWLREQAESVTEAERDARDAYKARAERLAEALREARDSGGYVHDVARAALRDHDLGLLLVVAEPEDALYVVDTCFPITRGSGRSPGNGYRRWCWGNAEEAELVSRGEPEIWPVNQEDEE